MAEPTLQELNDSIAELEAYRNRLRDDVIAMGLSLIHISEPTRPY